MSAIGSYRCFTLVMLCWAAIAACSSSPTAPPARVSAQSSSAHLGMSSSHAPASPSSASSASRARPAHPCPAAALGIRQGPRLSPETGEHGVIIAVDSVSSIPCTVTGYPTVTLLNPAGSRVPFSYLAGKGQYVTHRPPRPVILGAGKLAYFLVAKYRCDAGVAERATAMTLALPGQGTIASVPTSWLRGTFDLCTGGTTPDPGNTVMLSPFEPAVDLLSN